MYIMVWLYVVNQIQPFLNIQTNVGAKVQLKVWGGGVWAGLGMEVKAQGGGRVRDWTWDWQQSALLFYYYFHNAIVVLLYY